MEQLRLLKIECEIPGLIRINGELAGQTPAPNLCRYAAERRICLEFLPICQAADGYYLPLARIVDFGGEQPQILENDGTLQLFLLPENACTICIHPPRIPLPCIPCCIASFNFSIGNNQYTAEIYQDQTVNLALCDSAGNTLLACILSENAISTPRLFVRRIGGRPFLFAEGRSNEQLLLLCADLSTHALIFLEHCLSYQILENGIEFSFSCGCSAFCLRCLRTELHRDRPCSCHLQQLSSSPDGLALCTALIEAVRCRDAESALDLLAPSLREQLSFEDLCEFLGDVQGIYQNLCSDARIAVIFPIAPNLSHIRFFQFQLHQGKIANLEEQ